MKKVYQIYKTFDSYHEEGVEKVEIPTCFIFTNKELAEKVLNNKQFCSDLNVMCDEYIIKEFTLIESEEDMGENYTDIFTPLERKTLDEEKFDYTPNIITLTDEQMVIVINKLQTTQYGWHCDGCDCGTFEVEIEGEGFLTIDRNCHRSNGTDKNKAWSLSNIISFYSNSVIDPEYDELYTIDEREENGVLEIGELNKDQTRVLLEYARENTIKDLGYDEDWRK